MTAAGDLVREYFNSDRVLTHLLEYALNAEMSRP